MRCSRIADRGLRIADYVLGLTVALAVLAFAVTVWADTQAERAAHLAQLTSAEKEALLRKKQRFDKLEPAERDRLRKLHESLVAAADAQQLQGTLVRYSNWLRGLSPTQRSEILDMPVDERIARIKEIVRVQEGQRFRDFAQSNLPLEDQDHIYKWLEKFVSENEKGILDAIRDDRDRRWIRDIKDDQARRRTLITRLGIRWFNPRMPFPSNDEITAMLAGLSEMTRTELDKAQDPAERQARSHQLVWAAIGSVAYPPPSEEELRKFYAGLPADKRAELENLDAEQLQPALRKLYRDHYSERNMWRGGPSRGGQRPPGGDGPRGRGPGPGPGGPPDFGQPPPGFASPAPKSK